MGPRWHLRGAPSTASPEAGGSGSGGGGGDSSFDAALVAVGALAAIASVGLVLTWRDRQGTKSDYEHSKELYIPSRSAHGSESNAGDRAKIPRTNSTADLVAPTLPAHPEGPNIGPASENNWFQMDRDLPPKTDLLHKGHSKGGKLLVVMVGMPGTGKTYISRKVARYLRWINYRTRAFSLARYRHARCGTGLKCEFYDTKDVESAKTRREVLSAALEDMIQYLLRAGEVAILDGSNFTKERRQLIRDRAAEEDGFEILWVESICEDPKVLSHHVLELKETSPDYIDEEDFSRRLDYYREAYETVEMDEGSYVKSYDSGIRIEIHDAQGFVPTKITSFLMNLNVDGRPVFISRHGESMFNTQGLISWWRLNLVPYAKLYSFVGPMGRVSSKLASAQRSKAHQDENNTEYAERKQARQERLKNSEAKWKAAQEKKQSSPVRKGGKR